MWCRSRQKQEQWVKAAGQVIRGPAEGQNKGEPVTQGKGIIIMNTTAIKCGVCTGRQECWAWVGRQGMSGNECPTGMAAKLGAAMGKVVARQAKAVGQGNGQGGNWAGGNCNRQQAQEGNCWGPWQCWGQGAAGKGKPTRHKALW